MIGTNLTGVISGDSGDPVFPGHGNDNKDGDNEMEDNKGNTDDGLSDLDISTSHGVIRLLYDIMRGLFRYEDPTEFTAPEASAMTGLGIPDWYSFHVMAACQGYYVSKKGSKSVSFQTTNCTRAKLGCMSWFNIFDAFVILMSNAPPDRSFQSYRAHLKQPRRLRP